MNSSHTLTRPLAARIANLPEVNESASGPPTPQAVIEAAVQALNAGHTHYTDRPGIIGLRKRAAEYLGQRFGITLKPDEVTITCGATEGRFVAVKLLVKPGQEVLCPGDSAPIAGAAQLAGVAITQAPTSATSLLYITPDDSPEMLEPLLQQALERNWWVVYDLSRGSVSSEFHPSQNPALTPRVVTLGSLSKAMPGWRVGWMAGSAMANQLRAYKQSLTICTTSISQWAGMAVGEL